MYARRLKCRNHYLSSLLQKSEYSFRSTSKDIYQADSHKICHQLKDSIIRNCSNHYTRSQSGDFLRFRACHPISSFNTSRFFSSKGDGNNASEGKHCPVKDASSFENGSTGTEQIVSHPKHNNEHAWLGKQDQQEWLDLEKLSIESKRKESPFLTKRHKFKNEFLRRVVPWDRIKVSWSKFPYAFHEHTKNLLVECAASHLRHKGVASSFGAHLTSSSGRIMLQGVPGTELYRERMVKALAREMQVPLLILDSNVLAPYDFGQECLFECDSDDDNAESGDETTESDAEETNASNGEWTSSNEGKSGESDDDDDDAQSSAEAIKKLVPHSLEEFAKRVSGETEDSTPATESTSATPSKRPLRKGDRVKYAGATVHLEVENRSLVAGQRGEVYEINGDQVAVILDNADNQLEEGNNTKFGKQPDGKPSVYWIDIQDIVQDLDTQTEDWLISLEALCEILPSLQPVIVYFPDCSQWLSKAVPRSNRKEFISKVEQMFDQIKEPVVFICGENVTETGSKEKGKFTMVLPGLGRVAQVPLPLKRLTEGLGASKSSKDKDISQLFNNIISIHPPEEEEQLRIFNKQVEVDQGIITSRNNLIELHKVLREHDLACVDILEVKTDGIVITKRQAEKVAGWAKNHYLSTTDTPSTKGDKLIIPVESLDAAIARLIDDEKILKKPSQNLKTITKDEFEKAFVHALIPPNEIGVKFDDIGALEDVKKTLNELVSLPMKRPELFTRGNLLRPCKGILLFGPPGTGKTLLAKALATEAGANFLNITSSSLTSKWFGDAEKLTRALFSFARRLTPVVIFIDEVDSLLGARGGAFEHEATRRMRNEFMAAWDGLKSKDSQQILILAATNRPFDLDDAVIRRLPRRIYVDLPNAENRSKILQVLLSQENLEPSFRFDELANATEGYSGSDLKNLCVAAAYTPVQELLEEERKRGKSDTTPSVRSLRFDDFIIAKAKVSASVTYDATSMSALREWNEKYGEGGSRRHSPFGFGSNQ